MKNLKLAIKLIKNRKTLFNIMQQLEQTGLMNDLSDALNTENARELPVEKSLSAVKSRAPSVPNEPLMKRIRRNMHRGNNTSLAPAENNEIELKKTENNEIELEKAVNTEYLRYKKIYKNQYDRDRSASLKTKLNVYDYRKEKYGDKTPPTPTLYRTLFKQQLIQQQQQVQQQHQQPGAEPREGEKSEPTSPQNPEDENPFVGTVLEPYANIIVVVNLIAGSLLERLGVKGNGVNVSLGEKNDAERNW